MANTYIMARLKETLHDISINVYSEGGDVNSTAERMDTFIKLEGKLLTVT